MTGKLIKEISDNFLDFEGLEIPKDGIPIICKAMQAYHEAKMKEVTDEDIKKWALYDREYLIDYEVSTSSELNQRLRGREEGAKAMRDGKIVSSNRDY